jgi:hypothetical protein
MSLLGSGVAVAQDVAALQPLLPAARAQDTWSADVAREADHTSQAILWRSLGRLSLGLGWQWRPGELRLGTQPERSSSELLLGLAVRTGRQSRLSYQSTPADLLHADPAAPGKPPALVLHATDEWKSLKSMRRGMLRMNLDDDSSVGLRLRKKRVMLQYSKTW